jgi:hypothetical protein
MMPFSVFRPVTPALTDREMGLSALSSFELPHWLQSGSRPPDQNSGSDSHLLAGVTAGGELLPKAEA